MIDRDALAKDLRKQVVALEGDLKERATDPDEPFAAALRSEWEAARAAKRTAAAYPTWLAGQVTQAAVAWVLGTVFVRFCEDNGLIEHPYLAGRKEAGEIALERQDAFFATHPERTYRDWIIEAFDALSVSRVAAGLFDRAHNPMWRITPSTYGAERLLAFWRQRTDDGHELRHDFRDGELDTRFLGDLYEQLSEHARKTFALRQTPEFVEEFILDLTLDPALETFGLSEDFRLIDPACGSGHFLLGAFRRLLTRWEHAAPKADRWEQISRTLKSIHGVDKNPYAVAVSRFRLIVAALKAGGVTRLADTPWFPVIVAVGDSLLHEGQSDGRQQEIVEQVRDFAHVYNTEDIYDFPATRLLHNGTYHVVVGNPPYVNVDDRYERDLYRDKFLSCHGKYALTVPFTERFFKLAIPGSPEGDSPAGYVGQITSNSFMKREFGQRLVVAFLQTVDLTHVIDTSGAYLPGHGTPTVILIGRRRWPRPGRTVRTVRSVNGEPGVPADPEKGLVWSAIINHINQPGYEDAWVSIDDLDRTRYLGRFPWILAAGGLELVEQLEPDRRVLKSCSDSIGITSFTLEDDLYLLPRESAARNGIESEHVRQMVEGHNIRDWSANLQTWAIFPYDEGLLAIDVAESPHLLRYMWPSRNTISNNLLFAGTTKVASGLKWTEYGRLTRGKFRTPLAITYSEIATHNHFALGRGGTIFNRTAPVIKLPSSTTEPEHLGLLGLLNSSTTGFWLRQNCHSKGSSIDSRGARQSTVPWEDFYQFNSKRLELLPIPSGMPIKLGRQLDSLAQRLSEVESNIGCATKREHLALARKERGNIRRRMIALQEELDWEVYRLYGLFSKAEAAELVADQKAVPELRLGERAFEIVLARRVAAGETTTAWFERHRSTPITEIPAHWPPAYQQVVRRRIETIEARRDIALIERPECKRRWQSEPWEVKERKALATWLRDRCEARELWYSPSPDGRSQPRAMTINLLADRLHDDKAVVEVARLHSGPDADLAAVLRDVLDTEHVPYLAAYRYKGDGFAKRAQWEATWELQRAEDAWEAAQKQRAEQPRGGDPAATPAAGPIPEKPTDIPVPPKYKSGDFARPSYWRNRLSLDVPKERFISYPDASPDGDGSLLIGWAGWDHREQAHALMTLVEDRAGHDGWPVERLTPLIAGLAEVMPWVRQWHGEIDPAYGRSPAEAYSDYLDDVMGRHGLTAADLAAWRPPKRARRSAKAKPAAGTTTRPDPSAEDAASS